MKEEVKRDTYTDREYTIVRTDEHFNVSGDGGDSPTAYEYEFVLSIEGESVINAGTLELQGWEGPWVDALTRYAKAYIDGLTA